MPREILARARVQAEHSEAPVRAAALLHIARALTAFDPPKAREVLEEGLAQIESLDPFERDMLREEAVNLACAVDPERALRVPAARTRQPRHFAEMRRLEIMLAHGHLEHAVTFLKHHAGGDPYPFMAVPSVISRCTDETTKLELFRRAVQAWRVLPAPEFLGLFSSYWRLLPEEEARRVLHEIVDWILGQPEAPMQAVVDPNDQQFVIDSMKEYQLYEILNVLRRLEPAWADSLIAQHPRLAAAAARLPLGAESAMEAAMKEVEQRRAAGAGRGGGCIVMGAPEEMPWLRKLIDAKRNGDFDPPFEEALQQYRGDANPERPNEAVKECWPSAHMFRTILYDAAAKLGPNAEELLDRIPDADLRLFASIELAAALAGLPQYGGTTRRFTRNPQAAVTTLPKPETLPRDRSSGPIGPRIRCPKCGWVPNASSRWQCDCGRIWNTFDTGGVCPGCVKKWESTCCLACHMWSPHSDWYVYE